MDGTNYPWLGGFRDVWVRAGSNVRIPRSARTPLDVKWTLNCPKFTSTKTTITVVCGGVDVTATFLSPVEVCAASNL